MPELPEVEVTRLSIVSQIVNAKITTVQLGKPLRWALGLSPAALVGRTVHDVARRGKYLIFVLDQGLLLFHLGMSGSLVFSYKLPLLGKHDHFEMATTQGILRLHDPRRFGAVVYTQSESDPVYIKLLGKLGVEPLTEDFNVDHFYQGLKKRSASIKQVLLKGDLVVGVGNIYASEALFNAKIRPTKCANSIGLKRVVQLHRAIQEVLMQAVKQGGSTLRNFSSADGTQGHFQQEAMVYGRENLPCRVCAAPIRKIQQGQRTTYFCARCQH